MMFKITPSTKLFIGLAFLIYFTDKLWGHDNKTIHPMLMEKAYASWSGKYAVYEALGISENTKIEFQTLGVVPSLEFKLIDSVYGVNTSPKWTLANWLKAGAIDEDDPSGRCLAHFYNPISSQHELTDPYTVSGRNSYDWATTGFSFAPQIPGVASPGSNEESWSSARLYYWISLTDSTKANRDSNLAHVFYSLGKVDHLLQDLSQPEHVRNDAHMINKTDTPIPLINQILPRARWIENYGADHLDKITQWRELKDVAAVDWRTAGFKRVRDFWDRSIYKGANADALDADASGDPTKLLGLSEFTNGNFLGADASYAELVNDSKHHFEHPALSDTNYSYFGVSGAPMLASTWTSSANTNPGNGFIRRSVFLRKERSGVTVEKHAVLNYSMLFRLRLTGLTHDYPEYPAVTINAPDVLEQYHKVVLPKAIAYSAGLLDYFFRGQLDAYCGYDEQTQSYQVSVYNASGLPLNGGAFTIYWDDADGNRTAYTGVTSTYDASDGLSDGDWVDFTIPVPASGAAIDATNAIIVFKGEIGEVGADPDDPNAVAAVQIDLPTIPIPQPEIFASSVSVTKYKSGFSEFVNSSTPPKLYLNMTETVTTSGNTSGTDSICVASFADLLHMIDTETASGIFSGSRSQTTTISALDGTTSAGIITSSGNGSYTITDTYVDSTCDGGSPGGIGAEHFNSVIGETANDFNTLMKTSMVKPLFGYTPVSTYTQKTAHFHYGDNWPLGINGPVGNGTRVYDDWATLSNENTTSNLKAYAISDLPSFPSFSNGKPVSSYNLAINELSVALERSQYKFRFPAPLVGAGKQYQLAWVERTLPLIGGAGLSSLEIAVNGDYRPKITVDAPASGSTAKLQAVMAANGSVASVTILDAGSGYTVAPVVSFDPASGAGSQATATAVVDSNLTSATYGQITSVMLTQAGNYLPSVNISSLDYSVTQAVATCALKADGTLATVTLSSGGSGYTDSPRVDINGQAGVGGAIILPHFGAETAKTWTWDGNKPSGYTLNDDTTWPTSPIYEIDEPSSNGSTTVANVIATRTATP